MALQELQLRPYSSNAEQVDSRLSPDLLQARQTTIDAFSRNVTDRGVLAAVEGRFRGIFFRDFGIGGCQAMEKEQNGTSPILQEATRRTLTTGANLQGEKYNMITREKKGAVIHESHGPDSDQEHLASIAKSRDGKWIRRVNDHLEGENYRSLDSTLWWISLLELYVERTKNCAFLEALWPNFEAAVAWVDRYGSKLIKGGYEYGKSPRNLGWKDSEKAFMNEEGNLPDYPIAPLDVNCVACFADRKAADLYVIRGNHRRAQALKSRAEKRAALIDKLYWLDEYGTYAPAVDMNDLAVRIRTSDSVFPLWTGVTNGRAPQLAKSLIEKDLFIPGHGLLTRSTFSKQFNSRDYQNGNLWYWLAPMAAAGCEKYGLKEEAGAFDSCIPTIISNGFLEVSAADRDGNIFPYMESNPSTGELREVSCKNFTMAIGGTLNRLAA